MTWLASMTRPPPRCRRRARRLAPCPSRGPRATRRPPWTRARWPRRSGRRRRRRRRAEPPRTCSRLRNDSAACSSPSVRITRTEPLTPQSASSANAAFVDGVSNLRGVEERDRLALGVHGERAAQCGALLLAVDLEGVAARLRAEDGAAAGPDRAAARAGAGAAGALLAPRLRATAADLAAGLGGVRALAAGVELGADRLVDERAVERRAEGGVVELDGCAAGDVLGA